MLRINLVKDEKCDILADSCKIFDIWMNYTSLSYWMYKALIILRRQECIQLSH